MRLCPFCLRKGKPFAFLFIHRAICSLHQLAERDRVLWIEPGDPYTDGNFVTEFILPCYLETLVQALQDPALVLTGEICGKHGEFVAA